MAEKDLTEQEEVIEQKSEQAQQKALAPQETIKFEPQKVREEELVKPKEDYLLTDPKDIKVDTIELDKFDQETPTKKAPAKTYEAATAGDLADLNAAVG